MRRGFSTWLCPTELDRSRLLDNSARIRRARTISAAAIAGTLISFAPHYGLWVVALFAIVAANLVTLDWRCARSPRPQLHIAGRPPSRPPASAARSSWPTSRSGSR